MDHKRNEMTTGARIRKLLAVCAQLGLLLTAAAVTVSFLSTSWWIADLLANLRLQWLISAVFCLVVLIAVREPRWALVSTVVVAAALTPIWGGQRIVAPAMTSTSETQTTPLTVVAFNVLSTNTQHDAILEQIRRAEADVLVIVELSSPLAERIRRELLDEYPHFIVQPQDRGNFGLGLYSRFPLHDGRLFRLAASQVVSIEATIRQAGRSYRLYATHPVPPLPASGFESRNEHLQQLSARINQHRKDHQPAGIIVMGDLNVTPWSPVLRGFCQTAGVLRCSGSVQPTWYAKPMFPCGLVLDHILISGSINCLEYDVYENAGSDHRLIRAKLNSTNEEDIAGQQVHGIGIYADGRP